MCMYICISVYIDVNIDRCVYMCLFKALPYLVTNQVKRPNLEQKVDDKALPVEKVCAMVKNDTVNTKQKMKKKKNEDVNLVQKSIKILDTAEIKKHVSLKLYIYIT